MALSTRFGQQFKARAVQRPVAVAASHAFGFGGSNCVLLFGRGAG